MKRNSTPLAATMIRAPKQDGHFKSGEIDAINRASDLINKYNQLLTGKARLSSFPIKLNLFRKSWKMKIEKRMERGEEHPDLGKKTQYRQEPRRKYLQCTFIRGVLG